MTQARPADRSGRERVEALVCDWLDDSGLEHELGARPGEHVVQLPGEAKLRTTASVMVGERSLSVSAFVVRRPDENHEAFYRWLLSRNVRLPGIAFALDNLGDVYLVGRLPLTAVTEDVLDGLLGAVLATSDSSFNDLLVMGFLSSMKREWRWRVNRGEPTHNLAAFRHLLDTDDLETDAPAAEPQPHPTL